MQNSFTVLRNNICHCQELSNHVKCLHHGVVTVPMNLYIDTIYFMAFRIFQIEDNTEDIPHTQQPIVSEDSESQFQVKGNCLTVFYQHYYDVKTPLKYRSAYYRHHFEVIFIEYNKLWHCRDIM